MIVYSESAINFCNEVKRNIIVEILEENIRDILGVAISKSEIRSWQNSLLRMKDILEEGQLDKIDCGVLLEYNLPHTPMRIDFIVTGIDENNIKSAVIVELKQWENTQPTSTPRQVLTYLGNAIKEVNHPSVQAHSYRQYLEDYHTAFQEDIRLFSCAYLHNYRISKNDPLLDIKFKEYISDTPVFFGKDFDRLNYFITPKVNQGHGLDIIDKIKTSEIKPSKNLIMYVDSMLQNNKEFVLLDTQLVVYDKCLFIAENMKDMDKHQVVIVKGGPGTGKSVVGLHTLVSCLKLEECSANYLAPNAAFRNGLVHQIGGDRAKTLFQHPYFYCEYKNTKDKEEWNKSIAIVDEAHRLSNTPPMYKKKFNDDIVENIIKTSKLSIFYVDDYQNIRPQDIGYNEGGAYRNIKTIANKCNVNIYEYELDAQYRCAGSDTYIKWLDNILLKENNEINNSQSEFDIKVFDDPNDLKNYIFSKHKKGYNSRILAGYAWEWSKDLNPDGTLKEDVIIDKFDFKMPWNPQDSYKNQRLADNIPRNTKEWVINREGINQIGCIHTSQGLEFEYVGVIIGEELKYDRLKKQWVGDVTNCNDTKITNKHADQFINLALNTYRVLLTRGRKGVAIFACDKETNEYIKEEFNKLKQAQENYKFEYKLMNLDQLLEYYYNIQITESLIKLDIMVDLYNAKIKTLSKLQLNNTDDYYSVQFENEKFLLDYITQYEMNNNDISIIQEFEDDLTIRNYAAVKNIKIHTDLSSFTPKLITIHNNNLEFICKFNK